MTRSVRALSVIALATSALGFATPARAQVPVIESGREADVVALFAPYTLGQDIEPGSRFSGVAIESDSIVATVGSGSDRARLRLLHPRAPNAPARHSLSFALELEGHGPALAAAEKLADAVTRNDTEPFWRVVADTSTTTPTAAPSRHFDGLSLDAALLLWLLGLLWFSVRARPFEGEADTRWLKPGATALALLCITLLAAALRCWLAPDTLLGAWPFTRQPLLQQSLFNGPGLAWLSRAAGASFSRQQVVALQTLFFSVSTPAAVFVLACAILQRRRAALAAAFVLAILPLHIRFARSEASLVASLLLAALFLAQLRLAVRARSSLGATVGLLLCLSFAPLAFSTRPLDLALAPLAVAALLWLPSFRGPRHRRLVLGLGVSVVALLVLVDHVMARFGEQVHDGLHSNLIWGALRSVFSAHDTLLNATITPPALPALALLGLLWLARRQPRVAVGLAGWLGAIYVAHAYVVPETVSMQARYHLHLVLPFVLLAGVGCVAAQRRFPRAAWALAPLLLLSPLLTRGFVSDVSFDPQVELAFVRRAAAELPDGAIILEYSGGHGVRFGRLFDRIDSGTFEPRFRVITIDPLNDEEPFSEAAREALASGEELYIYQGIPCLGLPRKPLPTACEAVLRTIPSEIIAELHTPHRMYDENLAPHFAPGQPVPLRLYRVTATTSARSR